MKKSILFISCFSTIASMAQTMDINFLGRYTDGRDAACEISAYDSESKKLFVTNAAADSLDIVDVSDATNPIRISQIDVLSYGGGVNSVVALGNGYIAAAIEASVKQDSGVVVFYDTAGVYVNHITAGALPDMVTISHDGNTVLVANEGEPNDAYTVDPEGSVTLIDISGGVDQVSQSDVDFIRFNNAPSSINGALQKPNTTWAKDLEPEYIAVSEDDSEAYVVCQENNVLLVIDLSNNAVTYKGLGFKDHSDSENSLDPSNRDSGIRMGNWPVKGVYQPDAIATYNVGGLDYVVSANEGDARDYSGYSSETRIKDLDLDSTVFTDYVSLQNDSNLGRLKTFTSDMIGDANNDGMVEELFCYGGRSFSIWNSAGDLVYDSGDDFESYMRDNHPSFFNSDDGLASEFDGRSDDKGAEPEAVTIGKLRNNYFAFIGLERSGGIMVYDITNPMTPVFETFIHTYDEGAGTMTDIAPEGLIFIPASESHNGKNMLIVSNEVSGTTSIYEVVDLYDGIVEQSLVEAIQIYPNPVKDRLFVNSELQADFLNYQITDLMGTQIATGRISGSQTSIDVSGLSSGVYFLSMDGDTQSRAAVRFVKH